MYYLLKSGSWVEAESPPAWISTVPPQSEEEVDPGDSSILIRFASQVQALPNSHIPPGYVAVVQVAQGIATLWVAPATL
jgi:hypothetical protein